MRLLPSFVVGVLSSKERNGLLEAIAFERRQDLFCGLRWVPQRGSLLSDDLSKDTTAAWQGQDVLQEGVGGLCFDIVGFEGIVRKVLLVPGNDGLRATSNRRRQDVTVVGIGKLQPVDEVLVVGDQDIPDRLVHQLTGSLETICRKIGPAIENGVEGLIEDSLGPLGLEEIRSGQAYEEVPQWSWKEDAGVIDDDESHRSVPQTQLLGLPGELVCRRLPSRVVLALVLHEIRELHPSPVTHLAKGDLALLQ